MWNVINTRRNVTMFYRTEGDYRVWILEYPNEYEVLINNLAVDDEDGVKTVFDRAGYASFNEASEAAKFALHEIRYGA